MNQMVPFSNSAEGLAHWISNVPVITDQQAIGRAKAAVIDTFACILAARFEPVVQKVFDGLMGDGSGSCSVVGYGETFSAENAALINGTAAHALDFDDNFLPAVTHASAVLVPALLSLGEDVGASGDQILDAYIVGLEVQAWLGHHMVPAHYAAGWHATSTIGTVGAAAACARLLSLDADVSLAALSLATSMASGSKIQFGSMTKPLHAGLAARAGIMAAKLAMAGIDAHRDPFFGPWGFVSLHHSEMHAAAPDTSQLAIIKHGLTQKRWPCCASTHRTLDALFDLISTHQIGADDIDHIETIIPDSNVRNLRFNDPHNVAEARFSMTYCAAALVHNQTLDLSDFTPAALLQPEVQALMKRIKMKSAGISSDKGEGIWDTPAITILNTRSGHNYRQTVFQPIGAITEPLSLDELSEKFRICTQRTMPCERAAALLSDLQALEQQEVRHIAAYFRDMSLSQDRPNHHSVV
jgi:2-methylcitrate dehydratase PrpD